MFLAGYAFYQKSKAIEAIKQYECAQIKRLCTEAVYTLPKDNTKAIRIAEAAYNLSVNPSPDVMQILLDASISSLRRPFYLANLEHRAKVNSAMFSSKARNGEFSK